VVQAPVRQGLVTVWYGTVLQYDSWYGKVRGTILFAERYFSRYGTVSDDTVWHSMVPISWHGIIIIIKIHCYILSLSMVYTIAKRDMIRILFILIYYRNSAVYRFRKLRHPPAAVIYLRHGFSAVNSIVLQNNGTLPFSTLHIGINSGRIGISSPDPPHRMDMNLRV
jgi:hypothetical protein